MPKPEYTESCDNCIHYTKTSYMFGQCEMCQHEVACTAICTMFAERQIDPEMCREAEKVPVVVEKAGTVTNGDRIRQMTDDEELLSAIGTGCYRCIYSNGECDSGQGEGCITGNLAWLNQEANENAGHS